MLKEKLQKDQLSALKSGDKSKLETLRYILAQIKNKEIDKKADLTDEEVVDILRKQSKELQESIDAFKKGNRPDLIEQSEKQKQIVASYLPVELSDETLAQEIKKIIDANKELYNKNPKAIIGICMKELKTKADSSRIMKVLQPFLS